MAEKRLPNLQVFLAVLFSAAAIFAPLLMTRGSLVIGALLLLGLLLGGVSLAVAYRALIQKRPVVYPFYGWSLRLLRIFAGDSQVRALEHAPRKGQKPALRGDLRLLGLLNLALGGLLVLGMLYAALSLVM